MLFSGLSFHFEIGCQPCQVIAKTICTWFSHSVQFGFMSMKSFVKKKPLRIGPLFLLI